MLQGTVSLLLKDTIDSLQNTIDSYCMAQQIHIFNRQFYVATEISGIYCKAQYPKPTCSTTHGRYKTCPSQCTGKGSARGYETRSARTRVTTKWITTPIQKFPGKREGKEKKQNKMEGKRKIQKKKKSEVTIHSTFSSAVLAKYIQNANPRNSRESGSVAPFFEFAQIGNFLAETFNGMPLEEAART